MKELPKVEFKINLDKLAQDTKYHKGGFEAKMSKREACLILGVPPTVSKAKLKVRKSGTYHFALFIRKFSWKLVFWSIDWHQQLRT